MMQGAAEKPDSF